MTCRTNWRQERVAAMKEDKENTRPKERRLEMKCEDGEKSEKCKEKKEAMTKIVIRRLPPSLTQDELVEQLQPLPELDYLEFFSNDTSLYPHLYARAYINFRNQDDIVLFRDRFDGYVFIDSRGQEYPAIVEFAPFQKTAKKRSKKKDAKCGTIAEDSDYKRFLDYYNGDEEKLTSTPETLLEEIEAKSKELVAKKTTPLLDFLKNKQRIRDEKKEERRRRELERKRLRDEERRKWREEERRKRKGAEKTKKLEKPLEKDKDHMKEEPKIKLLKKPERGEDPDFEKTRDKSKKPERTSREERTTGGAEKRRHNPEAKDDRGWKEEEGRKDYRDDERVKERRLKRQEEKRRRKRERLEGDHVFRKWDEDFKKDRVVEKKRSESVSDSPVVERKERSKDNRKEESAKRERLRNKDRPAIQLYQPGARSRNRAEPDQKNDGEDKKPAAKDHE